MSSKVERFTAEAAETANVGQVLSNVSQFYAINTAPLIQLEAFRSGSDTTVQVSFPALGWPTLSANMSSTTPTGEIDMPLFLVGAGGNTINYANLRVSLQSNYSGGTPVNVVATLLLDVSSGFGPNQQSLGIVGCTYLLSF